MITARTGLVMNFKLLWDFHTFQATMESPYISPRPYIFKGQATTCVCAYVRVCTHNYCSMGDSTALTLPLLPFSPLRRVLKTQQVVSVLPLGS